MPFHKLPATVVVILSFWSLGVNSIGVNAQNLQPDPQIASLKFTLKNFRNPSQLRGRFGLLRFSLDGRELATLGQTRDIVIYDLQTGAAKATLDNGNLGFVGFSFSPDGSQVAAEDASHTRIRIFDASSGALLREISGSGQMEAKKAIIADSSTGLMGLEMGDAPVSWDWKTGFVNSREGEYQMVDVGTGKVLQTLEHSEKSGRVTNFFKIMAMVSLPLPFLAGHLHLSPNGKRLLITSDNPNPTLWDSETGSLIAKLPEHKPFVAGFAFSPDSKLLATSDLSGITRIWRADSGELLITIGSKDEKEFLCGWSPDSHRLVTSRLRHDAKVWDVTTSDKLFSLKDSEATEVVYSPDGRYIATYNTLNKKIMAQIWDAKNGDPVATLPRDGSEEHALRVVWSPDSKLLVTSSSDSVKLWDTSGKLMQNLENAVYPARFNSQGNLLATGGMKDTGFVWQIGRN
jgi:WD40 repeat protein